MLRTYRLLTLLISILLITPTQAGTLAEVKEKGTLRVAVYKDFPPYSYLNKGKMQGLDVDIAKALAERLGVSLSTMNLTASDEAMEDDLRNAVWKGHYLGGGTADVMMHVPVDDEFAEENDQVAIFAPYLLEEVVVAHHKERIPQMNNLLVFTREKIAVELETIADLFMSRAENGRLVNNVVHYRYVAQACEALKAEEVAAFMAPRAQLEACLENDARFAIAKVPARIGMFGWIVGLAVKSGHQELKTALHEAMRSLREDGSLEKIFAANGLSYTPPPIQ